MMAEVRLFQAHTKNKNKTCLLLRQGRTKDMLTHAVRKEKAWEEIKMRERKTDGKRGSRGEE